MAPPKKILGKVVHLYSGVDLMGSKTSIGEREAELNIVPYGVIITSKKSKRVILIPFSNIKGVELAPNQDSE